MRPAGLVRAACLLAAALHVTSSSAAVEHGSMVLLPDGGLRLLEGQPAPVGSEVSIPPAGGGTEDGGVAVSGHVVSTGNYSDAKHHASFFGQLRVETSASASDANQGYAAGYLEGFLTAFRIQQHYDNMEAWWSQKDGEVMQKVQHWLDVQDAYAQQMATMATDGEDSVPGRLKIIMAQLDGLAEGYAQAVNRTGSKLRPLSRKQLHLLNSAGDLLDLFSKMSSPIPWLEMTPSQVVTEIATSGHCSALIRVTPDLSDILMAHSSWFIYNSMLRIYKHYAFNVKASKMKRASFSSYPGVLSSLDDFYVHDTGLVLLQTTNSVFDVELYRKALPESLLAWQRVRIANMAASGQEWASSVAQHNSGTYNNQYMVVDLKKFVRGQALLPGLLWVVEQMPGMDGVVAEDMTSVLEFGYWPSFNVPYFYEVYSKSGYKDLSANISARGGGYSSAAEGLSYQTAPRSQIFRRDAFDVTDIDSLKYIMRYNGFPEDPLAGGSPFGAICSRGDVSPVSPMPVGCYDSKVTNFDMAMRMEAEAVNGPTTQDGFPAFDWARFPDSSHEGMPRLWDFEWEVQCPGVCEDLSLEGQETPTRRASDDGLGAVEYIQTA